MATKKKAAKKKTAKKKEIILKPLDMSFEDAIELSLKTKMIPKKK